MLRRFLFLIALTMCFFNGISQTKEELINVLIQTGNLKPKLTKYIFEQLNANGINFNSSDTTIQKSINSIIDLNISELQMKIRDFYNSTFSHEELKAYIRFYDSPEGKTILAKIQDIVVELDKIGALFAQNIIKDYSTIKNAKLKLDLERIENGCKKLHTGKFSFSYPDGTKIIIERNEKYQYQYYPNRVNKYLINWINECAYELTYVGSDALENELNVSKFKIVSFDNNIYKYISVTNGIDEIVEGSVDINN